MCDRTQQRRVSRVVVLPGSGAGGELDDLLGRGQLELGEDGLLRRGELGALAEGAGRAGESADVEAVQVATKRRPGLAGGGLCDADQQQRQPAQDDVGADAVLEAVVDGPQVDDLLDVAPAPLDLQQLLVAKRDVLSAQDAPYL